MSKIEEQARANEQKAGTSTTGKQNTAPQGQQSGNRANRTAEEDAQAQRNMQPGQGGHVENMRRGVGDGGYAPADPVSEHSQGTRANMQPVIRDSVTGEIVQSGVDLRSGSYREASQRAAETVDSRTGTQDGSGLEGAEKKDGE